MSDVVLPDSGSGSASEDACESSSAAWSVQAVVGAPSRSEQQEYDDDDEEEEE